MQDYITIDDVVIPQPDEEMGYDFETTYTEDSSRVQSGTLHDTAMFTVEAFSYKASYLTIKEMSTVLQLIVGRHFTLHYLSPYYGVWRDAPFRVGKGSLSVGRLNKDSELYDYLSFNMTGVDPI